MSQDPSAVREPSADKEPSADEKPTADSESCSAGAPISNKVWDAPVRFFHWSIVLLVLLLWYTGEFGGLSITASLPGYGDIFLTNMDIHAIAGQSVFVLVVFRILWGVWGSTTARFAHFVQPPAKVVAEARDLLRGKVNNTVGHNPLGGLMVLALLLLLLFQSVTGMFSADDLFYEGPLTGLVDDETVEQMSGLHHLSFSFLQALIALHIGAVVYYLLRGNNLIGAMISGRKKTGHQEKLTFSPWWLAKLSFLAALGLLLFLRSL